VGSEAWEKAVLDTYVETLGLAKTLAGSVTSRHCGKAAFIAFFQPMNYTDPADLRLIEKARARIKGRDDIVDVFDAYAKFGKEIFADSVHVAQPARDWMGLMMAKAIVGSAAIKARCFRNIADLN
jgi:hypothetical protein